MMALSEEPHSARVLATSRTLREAVAQEARENWRLGIHRTEPVHCPA